MLTHKHFPIVQKERAFIGGVFHVGPKHDGAHVDQISDGGEHPRHGRSVLVNDGLVYLY